MSTDIHRHVHQHPTLREITVMLELQCGCGEMMASSATWPDGRMNIIIMCSRHGYVDHSTYPAGTRQVLMDEAEEEIRYWAKHHVCCAQKRGNSG